MRALVCEQTVGIEGVALRQLRDPEPGACHVRIDVAAAGVNFADLLMLEGKYQDRPALPFVPGLEIAGTIDKVGAGAIMGGVEPGQRVLAFLDHGGFAEKTLARAEDVIPIPDDIDDLTAAAMALTYGTAFGALSWRAQLLPGEVLLVHGAAGGVGLAAVEVGRALGATVIATARGSERAALAREHGAHHALDSDDPELRTVIKDITGGRGVDVVFDPVGGAMFDLSLRVTAWEGRIVVVGFASGVIPQIPANLLLVKNVSAMGFFWGSYRKHDPGRLRESFEQIFEWLEEGKIRPHISDVIPLDRAKDAFSLLKHRRSTGKVVVQIAAGQAGPGR
ncbi:MAG TPA: NADPH:quinone oxidoreductase family protein [Geminicoccus sp.]|jgi:NADPH2:quinone reductase|uniref:NADPH:quinone oxidoreductase family protein n=1 Tax=Geminicoccus sp. TaxID=2024832 RepID=UPI002E339D64|nr:NADPH:quinone oxidoreductase family protein [Geminicoccus sp.]HEX2529126.1 NADPH:quinone oxidoreductase family protein [Geminicoccus sp.]